MITDKNKTPYAIYIQEDMHDKQYGINQSEHVRGMVKYIRSDYFPTNSEMFEIAKKMTFHLDDRLCSYSREELRARAWLEGYNFAKKNWDYSEGIQELITDYVQNEESELTSSNIGNVTVYEFIKRFSHNNAVWVDNRNNYTMYHKYRQNQEQKDGVVMDWELEYTDIADCNVIKISNVIHNHEKDAYTIVVDTDKTCFNFIPEKTTLNSAPAWLYEEVHDLRNSQCYCTEGDV